MSKLAIKLLIGAIVLISAGIAWARIKWAVGKNQREADRLIKNLKDGTYNAGSFADSLAMNIKEIPSPAGFELVAFARKLSGLTGKQLAGKFQVQHAQFDESNKGIIIAEGTITDTIGAGGARAVTLKMPCWMLVEHDVPSNKIIFRSTVPESSDHHYMQEQLAQLIVQQCA